MNFIEAARQYITSKNTINTHEKKKESAREHVLDFMRTNGHKKYQEDGYTATASHVVSHAISPDLLRDKHPEIFDAHANVTISFKPAEYEAFLEARGLTKGIIETCGAKVTKTLDEKRFKNAIDLEDVDKGAVADCIITSGDYWRITVKNGG